MPTFLSCRVSGVIGYLMLSSLSVVPVFGRQPVLPGSAMPDSVKTGRPCDDFVPEALQPAVERIDVISFAVAATVTLPAPHVIDAQDFGHLPHVDPSTNAFEIRSRLFQIALWTPWPSCATVRAFFDGKPIETVNLQPCPGEPNVTFANVLSQLPAGRYELTALVAPSDSAGGTVAANRLMVDFAPVDVRGELVPSDVCVLLADKPRTARSVGSTNDKHFSNVSLRLEQDKTTESESQNGDSQKPASPKTKPEELPPASKEPNAADNTPNASAAKADECPSLPPTGMAPSMAAPKSPAALANGEGVQLPSGIAFQRLPLVTRIEEPLPNTSSTEVNSCLGWEYRFDSPAQFPWPRFDLAGKPIYEQGVLIYEGMQFTAYEDGRYLVRFSMETPAMPIVLRLQLVLEDERCGRQFTLTLPTIFVPSLNNRADAQQSVRLIETSGYLPALKGNGGSVKVVRRDGNARMGFGIADSQ